MTDVLTIDTKDFVQEGDVRKFEIKGSVKAVQDLIEELGLFNDKLEEHGTTTKED